MYTLETNRLILRPLTWKDLDFLSTLHADPDVARYIGYGIPRTRQQSRDVLASILRSYKEDAAGQLGVCLKASGSLIGRCGVTLLEIEARPPEGERPRWYWGRGSAPTRLEVIRKFEIGYTFAKQHWGKGYATECAIALRDREFSKRDHGCLVSAIHPENRASRRVASKAGLSLVGEITAFEILADHYEISRSEWSRQRDESGV